MKAASFSITASIGFTTIEKTPEISVDILTIADKAMYAAKTSGKSRVVRGHMTPLMNP
jgi:PleD family two-component response regulator